MVFIKGTAIVALVFDDIIIKYFTTGCVKNI